MTAALPFVGLGLNLLGGMQQARASAIQSQAQQQQLQAQAAAATYNQRIAEQNVGIVNQQTQARLEQQDRDRRLRAGAAVASAGGMGIGIENFSDILRANAAQEELDLLTIKSEGALQARDYQTQAQMYGASATGATAQIPLVKRAASASKTAQIISSVSSGLNAYSSMGGKGF